VRAIVSIEDRRFFEHHGLDIFGVARALIRNAGEERIGQGGSSITQQLVKNTYLTPERTFRRKYAEAMLAFSLERRLSKEDIFALYCNEIYLGQRNVVAVRGVDQAARIYFGKELKDLTLNDAATIAGMIQGPSRYSPIQHNEDARMRRNMVLGTMVRDGYITLEQAAAAANEPLLLADYDPAREAAAPYFIDYVNRLERGTGISSVDHAQDAHATITTLDLDLQKLAEQAVQKQLAKLGETNKSANVKPQAALVALDPRTGEILAMIGGRDYAESQLNRATDAKRQPGSVFKPFVYAAALETGLDARSSGNFAREAEAGGGEDVEGPTIKDRIITPLTRIMDAPRVFSYAGEIYEPNNFKGGFAGLVSLRTALEKSLNSAAVQVAERIGYRRVAAFAHRMGLNREIKGYPSVALGAFEVTPVELAGAYTAFANEGKYVEPHTIKRVETPGGSDVTRKKPEPKPVLRPEIAYLMTHLMEGVINHGTGAKVRGRGFWLPAAGKTGTSRDGWFAGYTKDLLVITWVGFDDNRDLGLEGSRSALPIWTDFMLKVYSRRSPPKRMYFNAPAGIEFVTVDAETMMRATPGCTDTYEEAFIRGTAPAAYCPIHSVQFANSEESGDGNESSVIRAKPSDEH